MSPFDPVDTEPVWAAASALFAPLGQPSGPFQIVSRHHVPPPQLPPEMQPALFIVQARDNETRRSGLPGKMTLQGFLILYFQAPPPLLEVIGSETLLGATICNALLLATRKALAPDDAMGERCTLGGLVQHCWIEGDTDMDPGIYSQQGAAILPLRILVP